MDPTTFTLSLQAVFALRAFGWRTLTQYRASGSTVVVVHGEGGAVAKVAGLLLVAGLLALVVGTATAPSNCEARGCWAWVECSPDSTGSPNVRRPGAA